MPVGAKGVPEGLCEGARGEGDAEALARELTVPLPSLVLGVLVLVAQLDCEGTAEAREEAESAALALAERDSSREGVPCELRVSVGESVGADVALGEGEPATVGVGIGVSRAEADSEGVSEACSVAKELLLACGADGVTVAVAGALPGALPVGAGAVPEAPRAGLELADAVANSLGEAVGA